MRQWEAKVPQRRAEEHGRGGITSQNETRQEKSESNDDVWWEGIDSRASLYVQGDLKRSGVVRASETRSLGGAGGACENNQQQNSVKPRPETPTPQK